MVKAFSIISIQGGVGKSFVTAVLADFLAGATKQRVLVIDLGDFGALTTMLIGRGRQDEFCQDNLAVRLIVDRLDPENPRFDFDTWVQRRVSNVRRAADLDLLPSGSMAGHPELHPELEHSTDLLGRAVESYPGDYDVVLIDCPAWTDAFGIFAIRNALQISDGCIIPGNTHFNLLSGTTPILEVKDILYRVDKFAREIDKDIRLHGIVVNRDTSTFMTQRRRRPYVVEQLRGAGMELFWGRPPITYIPERLPGKLLPTAMSDECVTLRQKWGYQLTRAISKFANDILHFEGTVWDP